MLPSSPTHAYPCVQERLRRKEFPQLLLPNSSKISHGSNALLNPLSSPENFPGFCCSTLRRPADSEMLDQQYLLDRKYRQSSLLLG